MEINVLLEALRKMKVETGSFVCQGCGHEHNCGIHGCAILRQAIEALSNPWINAEYEVPLDPECMVLVVASGKPIENITLDDAYQLACYDEKSGWILEQWPEAENMKIRYWMPLPDCRRREKHDRI